MNSMRFFTLPVVVCMLLSLVQLSFGQGMAPSPAAVGPSSDGTTIDQGIACVLLLVALAITYFVH